MADTENYDVYYEATKVDENSVLVTSVADTEYIERHTNEILRAALDRYSDKKKPDQYSVFPSDATSNNNMTLDKIDELSVGINSNLQNLRIANAFILQSVASDSLLGRAYEAITSNIDTNYRLNYVPLHGKEMNSSQLEEVKDIIDTFNDDVILDELVREAISTTWLEGNYVMTRRESNGRNIIDHYPLNIAYPSEYRINRESVIEFSIDELKTRLKKTYQKDKKKKALYFEDMLKEIEANYPKEVSKAYKDGEKLVKLDMKNSACLKINSMGRRFGLSPAFKCLRPLIVIKNIETADVAASKTRSKKIIFQKLRVELMGEKGNQKGLAEQETAHSSAVNALKTNFVLYTAPPFVESLEYVTDKSTEGESADLLKAYTSKFMTALGIGFIDSETSTVTVASISIDQLLRTINAISEQFEKAMYRFYRTILEENNLDPDFAPKLKVCDSQEMEVSLRKDIASFIYTMLNGSLETAYDYIGLDFEEEKRRRQKENDESVEEIFFPRNTAYTSNGADEGKPGRPSSSGDIEKQKADKKRNETLKKIKK
ncbi:MAG: hypothetical protein RR365_06215 [Bacteroides sp.]